MELFDPLTITYNKYLYASDLYSSYLLSLFPNSMVRVRVRPPT